MLKYFQIFSRNLWKNPRSYFWWGLRCNLIKKNPCRNFRNIGTIFLVKFLKKKHKERSCAEILLKLLKTSLKCWENIWRCFWRNTWRKGWWNLQQNTMGEITDFCQFFHSSPYITAVYSYSPTQNICRNLRMCAGTNL